MVPPVPQDFVARSGRPARFLLATVAAGLVLAATSGAAAGGSPPELVAPPTVAGTATEGHRLTGWRGSWTGAKPIRYAYQWSRCDTMGAHCRPLTGATSRRRLLGPADVGHTHSHAVRAPDANGSATANAGIAGPDAGAPPPLVSLTQPVVSGDPVQGGTLRVATGGWKPKPEAFGYQWARCDVRLRACAPIPGGTADTYTVAPEDVDHALVAIVQARLKSSTRAIFSRATAPAVLPPPPPGPTATAPPLVAEVLQVGRQVTGAVGTWKGSGDVQLGYQWYRCDASGAHCKSIHGATGRTYTQVAKDVGQTLGFAVHGTDEAGTTSAFAGLVGPIAPRSARLVATAQPAVYGDAVPGRKLEVGGAGWTRAPTSVAYQWLRCNANGRLCAPIAGATAPTYVVTADDRRHALVALVTATAGRATQATLSAAAPVG
jgi:hypothetical protein